MTSFIQDQKTTSLAMLYICKYNIPIIYHRIIKIKHSSVIKVRIKSKTIIEDFIPHFKITNFMRMFRDLFSGKAGADYEQTSL